MITAGIGAILGTVLGLLFSLIVSRPLANQGFVFVLPIGSLIAFFVLAAIAGVVAAIPPARRAAKRRRPEGGHDGVSRVARGVPRPALRVLAGLLAEASAAEESEDRRDRLASSGRVRRLSPFILLAAVLLVSFGLNARVAANPRSAYQSADERSYGKLAIDIADRHHYGGSATKMREPLHWPPGAPLLFAVGHKLFPGADDAQDLRHPLRLLGAGDHHDGTTALAAAAGVDPRRAVGGRARGGASSAPTRR